MCRNAEEWHASINFDELDPDYREVQEEQQEEEEQEEQEDEEVLPIPVQTTGPKTFPGLGVDKRRSATAQTQTVTSGPSHIQVAAKPRPSSQVPTCCNFQ